MTRRATLYAERQGCCMDKTNTPNEKDREEQEDFWLTLEPLPVPDPEKPSAPHED